MGYLLLTATALFVVFTLLHWSEKWGQPTLIMLLSGHLTAAVAAAFLAYQAGLTPSTPTIWLGFGGGVIWVTAGLLLVWGIRHVGADTAHTVAAAAWAIPLLLPLAAGNEPMSWLVSGAAVLLLVGMVAVNPAGWWGNGLKGLAYAVILFLVLGLAHGWVYLFQWWSTPAEFFIFLTLLFTFASGLSWAAIQWKPARFRVEAMAAGWLLGAGLVGYFYGLWLGLAQFGSAGGAFATVLAFTLLWFFPAGLLFWPEKFRPVHLSGAVCAGLALLLLQF